MAHTYSQLITHLIFSTQNRIPYLKTDLRDRLFRYMAGIVRGIDARDVLVNGVSDHVHILMTIPPALAVAAAVNKIKANSSKWIHEQRLLPPAFAWQTGYAAFSVSPSKVVEVIRYIENQELHHQKLSFQEEYLAFLKAHRIEYNTRYLH
jgi:REP element-mobilizing transposase RayT